MESHESGGLTPRETPSAGPLIRASDRERDDVLHQLQAAFAEGRLGDEEFDERMRSALTAQTRADLDRLLTDLPATRPSTEGTPVQSRPAGRLAVAYKNFVSHGGRWRVPDRCTTLIYKGGCQLDLRAAELTAPVTTIFAVAYKSDVEIIVPPGVRVELGGLGVTSDWSNDGTAAGSPDAPVVRVRGFAYKGQIETRTRPRQR